MNNIVDFNEKSGIVTLEPGVTQGQLYEFLQKKKTKFLVPLTGAGPKGSLVGNALERGFGVTPFADHFNAVTTVTAVLADGTVYNSALEEYGCAYIDQLYRYGIGPYLDGIFTQSNFGIVTKMSISLARAPDTTSVFFFSLNSHDELEDLIDKLPKLLTILGPLGTSIKFINKHQLLAMDGDTKEKGKALPFPEWTVTGGLFGDRRLVKAAKKIMKQELDGYTHRFFFLNAGFFHNHIHWIKSFPLLPSSLKHALETLSLSIDLFLGKPTTAALPLAYIGSGTFPKKRNDADPGKDGAGIIWFAPLLPIEGKLLRKYTHLVETTLEKYNLPKLLSFTSVNDRCFDAPLAIVFDKNNPEEVINAKKCYDELWNESLKLGLMPYRLPVDEHHRVTQSGTPFWDIAKKIKDALDPNNVIAPGRYSK
jgi:hypothetical protein